MGSTKRLRRKRYIRPTGFFYPKEGKDYLVLRIPWSESQKETAFKVPVLCGFYRCTGTFVRHKLLYFSMKAAAYSPRRLLSGPVAASDISGANIVFVPWDRSSGACVPINISGMFRDERLLGMDKTLAHARELNEAALRAGIGVVTDVTEEGELHEFFFGKEKQK